MKKIFQFLKKNTWLWIASCILLVVELLVIYTNYEPHTWLIGWDATMPELNFSAHWYRNLYSVWQEYRGVGVFDGMAHSANLVHWIYIYLLSFIFKVSDLRYVFIFLMHLSGMLGMLWFLSHQKIRKQSIPVSISLASALFYGLNPYVIQMFYAPLELFVIHFGFLPWLFLALQNYLERKNLASYLLFVFVNILALSQAHVPTIFIVYSLSIGITILIYLGWRKINISHFLAVIVGLLIINGFWFVPYVLSALENAPIITASKMNQLSNDEIRLRNESFGDFEDLALMRGFSLEFEDWLSKEDTFGFQMQSWRVHWDQKNIVYLGWAIFLLGVIGILLGVGLRNPLLLSVSCIYIFAVFNLGTNILVIKEINQALQLYIPYYREVFRFSFTKFSIIYAFSFTVGVSVIFTLIAQLFKIKYSISAIFSIVLIIGVIVQNKPVFEGQFFYDEIQREIPSQYFELFDYFNQQPVKTRVAILPQPTLYGWGFMRWGYRGSGFEWQGIPQATMHRAFDPWSQYNEQYYNQLSTAIFSKNSQMLSDLLDMYAIDWVIIDNNNFQPGGWEQASDPSISRDLLTHIPTFTLDKIFGFSTIEVYKRKEPLSESYISIKDNLVKVTPQSEYARDLTTFQSFGSYVEADNPTVQQPFGFLESEVIKQISYQENFSRKRTYTLSSESLIDGTMYIPALENGEQIVLNALVNLYSDKLEISFQSTYKWKVGANYYSYELPLFRFPFENSYDQLWLVLGNKRELFKLGESKFVNQIQLQVGQPLKVSLFENRPEELQLLPQKINDTKFSSCWKRDTSFLDLQIEPNEDQIEISTINQSACGSMRIGFFDKPSLIDVRVNHLTNTNSKPQYCVVSQGANPYKCLHSDVYSNSLPSKNSFQEARQLVYLEEPNDYWIDLTARADPEKDQITNIIYKTPQIVTYPLIQEYIFPTEIWDTFKESLEISIKNGETINFEATTYAGSLNLDSQTKTKNCDLLERGLVESAKSSGGVLYAASKYATACDYLSWGEMSNKNAFLMRVEGEGFQGRGLKIYLHNIATRKNDLEYLFPRGSFDATFSLLSWPEAESNAYDITLETRSFGNDTGENMIHSIDFYQVPYDFLTAIQISSNDLNPSFTTTPQPIADSQLVSKSTGVYEIEEPSTGYVILHQGYNKLWKAYPNGSTGLGIWKNIFKSELNQVRVNSWANGWLITEPYDHLVIVFLPHIIQLIGYIILIIFGVGLIFLSLYKRLQNKGVNF